jgi:hypothetical protein
MKITPDNITELNENEIFVFGSNMSGQHSKGAAKTAMKWGAIYGQAAGLQGRTYGIPTVNASITNKLSINKIKMFVEYFYNFVNRNLDKHFLITEIGCGLAGHNVKDIAPLFRNFINLDNVSLPKKFIRILK